MSTEMRRRMRETDGRCAHGYRVTRVGDVGSCPETTTRVWRRHNYEWKTTAEDGKFPRSSIRLNGAG